MTTTEEIRRWLRAGATPESIALAFGVRLNRVRVIRWRMKNPEYHRVYMRRWRECNPEVEKARRQRSSMQKLIRAEQAHQARKAERVQKIVGPSNWYG